MPERGFSTEFWADTFVEDLPPEGKLLYAYLWTNPHCNQAGLYKISLSRIAYETKLPMEELPSLIELLEPKVKWYPDENLIWVKNFIKHQYKSPKFLIAAASRLKDINNNGVVRELIEYNLKKYTISIPYTYSMDTVCISDSDTSASASASASAKSKAGSGEIGVVKGEEAVKGKAPQFELFWKAYPKKRNKGQAERAFKKAAPDEQLMAAILTAIERAKKSAQWLKDNGQYIPYPATWLNAKGWEDEFEEDRKGGTDGETGKHRQDTQRDAYEWQEAPEPDDTS